MCLPVLQPSRSTSAGPFPENDLMLHLISIRAPLELGDI